MKPGLNTKLTLSYCDADGWKKHLEVVVAGKITTRHVEDIRSNLFDSEFLLAHQVGLPNPQLVEVEGDDFPCASDHALVEIKEINDLVDIGKGSLAALHTSEEPTVDINIDQLAKNIKKAEWDFDSELEHLGLDDVFDPSYGMM